MPFFTRSPFFVYISRVVEEMTEWGKIYSCGKVGHMLWSVSTSTCGKYGKRGTGCVGITGENEVLWGCDLDVDTFGICRYSVKRVPRISIIESWVTCPKQDMPMNLGHYNKGYLGTYVACYKQTKYVRKGMSDEKVRYLLLDVQQHLLGHQVITQ